MSIKKMRNKELLQNLVICNEVRELLGLESAITLKDIKYKKLFIKISLSIINNSRKINNKIIKNIINPFIIEPLVIIFFNIIIPKKNNRVTIFKSIRNLVEHIIYRLHFYQDLTAPINEFLDLEKKDFIKSIHIVYSIGRYGEAIKRFLKYNQLQNDVEYQELLNFFLNEIMDEECDDDLNNKLKYFYEEKKSDFLLVVATVDDSKIFRSSLLSLIESDFNGKIVVVEDGLRPGNRCKLFCQQHNIPYLKLDKHAGTGECFNVGIREYGANVSHVIFCHNDILWPKKWYVKLSETWNKVETIENIGLINLSYIQYNHGNILDKLFVDRNYTDLIKMLNYLINVNHLEKSIDKVLVLNEGSCFGIPYDPWNSNFNQYKIMAGRWSVAASIPKKIWDDIGGFTPNIFLADIEIQDYCMTNKKLMLWLANDPLVHARSSDTNKFNANEFMAFREMEKYTYEFFKSNKGYDLDSYLKVIFHDIYIVYKDEIIYAVTNHKYQLLDYIFTEYKNKLKVLKK